ncbi:hypothetical protein [Pseudodesulfovibrio piezophilus]|uniref:Cytochrome c domain-containing protein n=1 Tax=Pseudodesulfovibrio piezophilus (strain DSM 21447 / JCM 15486 / C1TLV30) TaxID=1322246 RepID=M1WLW5_PSEP2|nr:hypothetical protein [Pseudodesulfovibrio piezophilus]CCH48570.1 conserved exported protein of unknown function [Pseudodesulfovibrio piezophilus C1TLV30]
MNLVKFRYQIAVSLFCSIFFLAGFGLASDMGTFVEKTCTKCHSAKRICLNLGVKSGPAWKSTVEKMVAKGAQVAPEKIEGVALYLAGANPDSSVLCR